MYEIGSVILIENQIFKNNKSKREYELDHCKRRPAIVIAEDETSFYYLTLTSKKNKKYKDFELKEYVFADKLNYVKLENIYTKKIYGALEQDRISDNDLFNLLTVLYNEKIKSKDPMLKKIEKQLLITIKNLAIDQNSKKYKK